MPTFSTALLHICALGFISGKRKATIPWAKVTMDPTAWIQEECYPPDFKWMDPSKVRLAQVFYLLDHWRQRKEDGLTPLIWNPSCELLTDMEKYSGDLRSRRQRQHDSSSESDDEVNSENLQTRRQRQNVPNSENDAEEENFDTELNRIFDNPPSPHPTQREPGASNNEDLGEAETGSPPFQAPALVQHQSCKSGPFLHAFHCISLTYCT